jgi:hypothetical protein
LWGWWGKARAGEEKLCSAKICRVRCDQTIGKVKSNNIKKVIEKGII